MSIQCLSPAKHIGFLICIFQSDSRTKVIEDIHKAVGHIDDDDLVELSVRVVKSVNGKKITIGREIDTYTLLHPLTGEDVDIVVTRNGEEKSFKIDPNYKTYLFGFSYATNEKASAEVSEVTEGKAFDKAGLKAGDIIKEINGKKINNAGELSTVMNEVNGDGKEVTFLVDRKGEEKTFRVTPEPYSTKTLGFIASMDEKSKSSFDVVKYSFVEVKYWIETTVGSLGALITGNVSVKNVSGPVKSCWMKNN